MAFYGVKATMLDLYSFLSVTRVNSITEMQKTSQICKECQLTGITTRAHQLGQESLKATVVDFAGAFYNSKSCI